MWGEAGNLLAVAGGSGPSDLGFRGGAVVRRAGRGEADPWAPVGRAG